jgi:hypothetical protein
MIDFITTLAWFFGILSTLFTILRIVGFMMYSDLDKIYDKMRGVKTTYSVRIPGLIAILCWSWIISQ